MTNLERCTSITYPASYMYVIQEYIQKVAWAAGGCTTVAGQGTWIDDSGKVLTEGILRTTFAYDECCEGRVNRALARVIIRLLDTEQSVMLEFHSPYYSAVLYDQGDADLLYALQDAANPTTEMMRGMIFGTEIDNAL